MPWVKIDDGFFDNATNRRLGAAGRDLFIAGLAYCAKGLTDGRIDKADVQLVLALAQARKATVAKLVESGRWVEHADHYEVAEYLAYQPSKAQVLAEREAAKERQRRRRHGVTPGVTHAERSGEVTGTPTRPDLGTTPQPPAERGATGAAHDGQHPNCRPCGTNRRGPKPQPPERPFLPPNHAPEEIADLDHHPTQKIPDDAKATARQGLAEVHAALRRPRPTRESA